MRRLVPLFLMLCACGGGGSSSDAGPDGTVSDGSPSDVVQQDASDGAAPCFVDAAGATTLVDAVEVSVAANGVCILRQGGTIVCSGLNRSSPTFPTNAGAVNLVHLEAGYTFYGCASDDTRRLWCWGKNDDGQLGTDTIDAGGTNAAQLVTKSGSPLLVDDFAAGFDSVCAIEHGTRAVYCWGYSANGQLGDVDASAPDGGPTGVYAPTLAGITASPAAHFAKPRGAGGFCLVDASSVVCWGQAVYGTSAPLSSILADAGASFPLQDLSLGNCAVDSAHRLDCWCFGGGPPCANGAYQVSTDAGANAVSCGAQVTCLVDGQRHAECFGNGGAALGNGDTTNQPQPTPGPVVDLDGGGALPNVVDVSAGVNMGCARTEGSCGPTGPGAVYCWGQNVQNSLGNPDAGSASYVPLPYLAP